MLDVACDGGVALEDVNGADIVEEKPTDSDEGGPASVYNLLIRLTEMQRHIWTWCCIVTSINQIITFIFSCRDSTVQMLGLQISSQP